MEQPKDIQTNQEENTYPGYPASPKEEDVYHTNKVVPLIPENDADAMDMGLDVPGADADNAAEAIGNEDEENNYYSLPDQDD